MTTFTWDAGDGSSTADWTGPANWDQGASYPQAGDTAIFPSGKHKCYVNAASECATLTVNGDTADTVLELQNTLLITGDLLITDGIMNTAGYDLTVSGTTDIYGTLTPGASTCYFGYGNTASSDWDLGVRGTGVLNAGTGDWYTGGVGCYSSADVSLTSGVMYISGTVAGYLWSPDQGVGSWDNRDGTVILQKTGEVRTLSTANPLTAADNAICPFHTLIVSGGTDRTDAPVITLKRGLKVDDELIIKNGVLKWNTYAGSYGDVWVGTGGTQLIGAASQSAAIVMDDMPMRSKFVSHSGSSTTDWGMYMEGNAIVSGATANIHLGTLNILSDSGDSASAANKTITGLNGSPYFHFPSGEACAVFGGMPEGGASSGEYINVGDVDELDDTQNFTISMWVKFGNPAPSEKNYLFAKGPSGVNSTKIRWSDGSGGNLYWYINSGSSMYGRSSFTAATGYGWNHIAMVFDGTFDDGDTTVQNNGRLKAYVNGVLQTINFYGDPIPDKTTNDTPTSEAVLGITEPGSSTSVFFGSMADVRIYDESKDITAVAALAATNPATSTTGSYPATGTGLVGWWKLQPVSIIDGTGSGDMDFTDSSTSSYDATNVGTSPGWGSTNIYQRTSWISLRSYQRDLISNNTFGAGVEGRGSTMYIRPAIDYLSVSVADSAAENSVTNYAAGLAFKFNNFNICPPSAGNGILRSQSRNTGCGLLNITGDLFIASGSSLVVDAHSSIDTRTDDIVGDIYVSGNLITYGTADMNDSTMVDALDAGYISRMSQLLCGTMSIGPGSSPVSTVANYNATPYHTVITDEDGSPVGGRAIYWRYGTFTHNSGSLLFTNSDANMDQGPNTLWNVSASRINFKHMPDDIANDFTIKETYLNGWPWTTKIGGDLIITDAGGGSGFSAGGQEHDLTISGSVIMQPGSKWGKTDYGASGTRHIYGGFFNNGGTIY